MLKLRLSRGGTKKRPVYKVVVADSRFARDGRFIEKVGFFNPLLPKDKKERVGLEAERIKYWLGQGAQPTTRVARILGENELIQCLQMVIILKRLFQKKREKKKVKKLQQLLRLQQQKRLLAAEAPAAEAPAAEAPKEEAPPAAEAPKEEAPAAEAAPAAEGS